MRSAFSAAQRLYCSVYVQNSFRFRLSRGFQDVLPVRLQGWSSFPPQSISSVSGTTPQHRRISPSDPPDLRSSTPAYVPGYPLNGTDPLYFSTAYHTIPCSPPACRLRSSPVFQTDGSC